MFRINRKEVAARIKTLRLQQGLTQVELAKAIGTQQNIISRYEVGTRVPKAENLVRLARVGETTVDFILVGDPYSHW